MSTSTASLLDSGPVLRVPRGQLADALTVVAPAVSTSTRYREAARVLLTGQDDGTLVVSAYDYTLALSVPLPGAALAPGRLVCDHRELTRLLRAVTAGDRHRDAATVPVTVGGPDPAAPTLSAAGFTVPVTAQPLDDYPTLPAAPPAQFTVDGGQLSAALTRVTPALGREALLPLLTGIHLHHETGGLVQLATTDRYRLAVTALDVLADADAEVPRDVTIPGTVHTVAPRWAGGKVGIGIGPSRPDGDPAALVSLTGGNLTVVAHTLDGTFPPWSRLLPPRTACTVVVDRTLLHRQIQRVAALLKARTRHEEQATVTVRPDALVVAPWFADRPDQVAAPELPAEVTGLDEPRRWLFKPGYLLDAVSSFTSPTVTLHLHADTAKPVLLTAKPDELTDPAAFRHLVMPIVAP